MNVQLSALLCLVSSAAAQNLFEIYPDRPGIPRSDHPTTRLTLGLAAGEILMEVPDSVPESFFKGVGGDCFTCGIDGVVVTLLDRNGSTRETFRFVIRANLAAGGPDMTIPPLYVSPPQFSPVTPPGPVSFSSSVIFPCLPIPCTGGFSIGVELAATVAGDGLEVYAADYGPVASFGDFPKVAAPAYAWSDPAGFTPPASSPVALLVGVRTCDAPVLNMGNIASPPRLAAFSHSYGVGGMRPDPAAGRGDGLSARLVHQPHANGLALLAISAGVFAGGIPAPPPFCDMLYPDFSMVIVALGGLDTNGEIRSTILPPAVRAWLVGSKVWFQGISVDVGLLDPRLTNAQAVQF